MYKSVSGALPPRDGLCLSRSSLRSSIWSYTRTTTPAAGQPSLPLPPYVLARSSPHWHTPPRSSHTTLHPLTLIRWPLHAPAHTQLPQASPPDTPHTKSPAHSISHAPHHSGGYPSGAFWIYQLERQPSPPPFSQHPPEESLSWHLQCVGPPTGHTVRWGRWMDR